MLDPSSPYLKLGIPSQAPDKRSAFGNVKMSAKGGGVKNKDVSTPKEATPLVGPKNHFKVKNVSASAMIPGTSGIASKH